MNPLVCHDFRMVASLKQFASPAPPPFSSENVTEMAQRNFTFHECHATRYHCVDREQGPRCSRRLPSRVFKFGEVRQLALSQQMPHAVAVQVSLGRQLLVQRQTNIVCLPASLCVCLRHLTRRLHTIATFIASHSNQLFSTDSAELAGGIVL